MGPKAQPMKGEPFVMKNPDLNYQLDVSMLEKKMTYPDASNARLEQTVRVT